jgi:hypothetical protein
MDVLDALHTYSRLDDVICRHHLFMTRIPNVTPVTVAARSSHELSSLAWTLGSWIRIPWYVCAFILCLCSVFR